MNWNPDLSNLAIRRDSGHASQHFIHDVPPVAKVHQIAKNGWQFHLLNFLNPSIMSFVAGERGRFRDKSLKQLQADELLFKMIIIADARRKTMKSHSVIHKRSPSRDFFSPSPYESSAFRE
jgi:hypothetical protein